MIFSGGDEGLPEAFRSDGKVVAIEVEEVSLSSGLPTGFNEYICCPSVDLLLYCDKTRKRASEPAGVSLLLNGGPTPFRRAWLYKHLTKMLKASSA